MILFGPEWFDRYQPALLWLANTMLGRYILRIHGERSNVGSRRIIRIGPNFITWSEGSDSEGRSVHSSEFRTHNKFSRRLFHGLYPLWFAAHCWDTLIANPLQPAWNLGFDTLTAYPDTHPEVTTFDGYVSRVVTSGTWSDIHDGAGTHKDDSLANSQFVAISPVANQALWNAVRRGMLLFDTESIPDTAEILSGSLYLFVNSKGMPTTYASSFSIYGLTTASDVGASLSDYSTFGNIPLGSIITYAAIVLTQYNTFTMNATGRAAISKTGITKIGLREASYDGPNIAPPIATTTSPLSLVARSAETTGTSSDPYLLVTYSIAAIIPAASNYFRHLKGGY